MARAYSDIEHDKKIISMSDEEIIKEKATYLLYLDKMDMIEYLSDEDAGKFIKAVQHNRSNVQRGTNYPEPDFSNNPMLDLIYRQILNPFSKLDKNYAATTRGKANNRLSKDEKAASKNDTTPEKAAVNMADNAVADYEQKIAASTTMEQLNAIDTQIDNCEALTPTEEYQLATSMDNRSMELQSTFDDEKYSSWADKEKEIELPFPEVEEDNDNSNGEFMELPFD